jgi:hypothetical protein
MERYRIQIHRGITLTYEIDAESQEEAEEEALIKSGNEDWHRRIDDADSEVWESEAASYDPNQLAEALEQIMHNHRSIPIDTPIGEVVTILQEMLQNSRSIAFKALGMDKIYAELDAAESR